MSKCKTKDGSPDENQRECCSDQECGCKGDCNDNKDATVEENKEGCDENKKCGSDCGEHHRGGHHGCDGHHEGDHRGCGGHNECDKKEKQQDPEEEALNIKYMRLMADFQNYKRRTEKERLDTYAYANEKIVSELLNVIDNFERALDAGQDGDSFVEGMKLIFTQMQGVLEKSGVSEIKSLGEDFDPNFHSAVMTEDSAEYDSGKVTEVLQKGYTLNGKVVRPAMVKVAN